MLNKYYSDLHNFHESYYAHNCVIDSDKDVLDTEILGNTFGSKLKRWWYDLFLLSYRHHKAREVYFSSHAMRMARTRQFRIYKSRIHPMSKFRLYWDLFIFITIVILKLSLPISTSIFYTQSLSTYYVLAGLEIFPILDIYVNMKTGYVNKELKEVILDTRASLIHFCSMKLFIYVISATPLHWLMFLRYGNNITCLICKANEYVCCLKFMTIFSLYRTFELSARWRTTGDTAISYYNFLKFVRINILMIITLRQVYSFNLTIKLINFFTRGQSYISSFLGRLLQKKFAGEFDTCYSNVKLIIISISRVLQSLLLFNLNLWTDNPSDFFTILSIYICVQFFYLWTVLELLHIFSQYIYPADQHLRFKCFTNNLLSMRQLPNELKSKVDQYFAFHPCLIKLTETDNRLYKSLPDVLKREIVTKTYMKHLQRLAYFKEWPFEVLEDLTVMMKIELFLADDVIVEAGEQGAGLMVVDRGVVAVYSSQQEETSHLIDGDAFGEVSLVTDKETSQSYVVAVTSCVVCVVIKQEFRKYMRKYPKLFYQLRSEMMEKYKD